MNFTIIFIILIIALALGLPMGFKYLSDKKILNSDSLKFTIELFKLSTIIINELNLKQETQITKITDLVLLSLNYVCDMDSLENREVVAINYCIELCNKMGFVLDDNRLNIISELIKRGLYDSAKVVTV